MGQTGDPAPHFWSLHTHFSVTKSFSKPHDLHTFTLHLIKGETELSSGESRALHSFNEEKSINSGEILSNYNIIACMLFVKSDKSVNGKVWLLALNHAHTFIWTVMWDFRSIYLLFYLFIFINSLLCYPDFHSSDSCTVLMQRQRIGILG